MVHQYNRLLHSMNYEDTHYACTWGKEIPKKLFVVKNMGDGTFFSKFLIFQHFIKHVSQHTTKLKEFYSEYLYIITSSTVNMLYFNHIIIYLNILY